MATLEFLESPKLISRKIWVIEKFWNFHTVKLLLTWDPCFQVAKTKGFMVLKSWSLQGTLGASMSGTRTPVSEVRLNLTGSKTITSFHGT